MNKVLLVKSSGMVSDVTARGSGVRDWQRWAPYAAVAWSLVYAALGAYWLVSGRGFPYSPELMSGVIKPVVGWFGSGVAWVVVIAAGLPAAAVGTAMLRGTRSGWLRSLLITAGALLAAVLLLLMTDLILLEMLGYIPFVVFRLLTGAEIGFYLQTLIQTQWIIAHQLLCLIGGFLWLAAIISYARRSGDTCLYCGRRDGPEGWNSPDKAARWGRIAVYVAMAVPVFYALTRYAWALGIPLGMSVEHLRSGQESGIWISGLFLANFGLVGALLMLGLVQRWGEVFPSWMIGLAGRRVPIALAVVPASIVSVLFMVGGITIWSDYAQMADAAAASGEDMGIFVGPVLLFPVWAVGLAVATLGYYYRRRGPCSVCGRGASGRMVSVGETHRQTVRKILLACGIIASLLYIVTSIIGAMRWDGYDPTSQCVSELFAVGAPSKSLVDPLLIAYSFLWIAFGVGVWLSAEGKLALRIAAAGLIGKEIEGLVVQLNFPMHMRGVETSSSDPLHGILTYVGVLSFLIAMGFGSVAFGKRFRIYSIATLVVSFFFSALTGLLVPAMVANQPTPFMGVWERIGIFSYLLWAVILAIGLLRAQSDSSRLENNKRIIHPEVLANRA